MKLYMHPVSMTCRPVRLFAAENKIAIDEELVDLMTGAHLQPPYSKVNPNCLVPMLEDGDLKLTESSAILKYLADKIGSPAYPKDLKQRAKVNEAMDWINTNFYRDWGYNLCYPQLFPHLKRRSDEAQAATLEFGKENAKRWLGLLDNHWLGPNKPYLCGNEITIADYFGSGIVTLGEAIGVDFSPYPNVVRWLEPDEGAAELEYGQRGVLRPRRLAEGTEVRYAVLRVELGAQQDKDVQTMSFFPGKDPAPGDKYQCDALKTGDRAAHRRPRRRLHGAPRAAVGAVAHGRAVRVLRSFRAGGVQLRQRPRRAAASAYRARHRHLSVRRRDHAPRQPRHRGADPAGRGQLDDRRPRHRAFRAHRHRAPRHAATACTACRCGWRCRRRRRRWRRPSRTMPSTNFRWCATTAQSVRVVVGGAYGQRSPVKTTSETLFADAHAARPAARCRSTPSTRSARSTCSTARSTSPATASAADRLLVFKPGDAHHHQAR